MTESNGSSHILFETEDVAVIMVAASGSRQTVITFFPRLPGPRPGPVTGLEGFGRAFLIKNGITGIHVVPKWNHWWQSQDMPLALDVILRNLPRNQEVWTYGASMGGNGALMFARQLGATGVLALNPQASVDLSRASFDPRWIEDRKRIPYCDDKWLEVGAPPATWLLCDPGFKLDQQHIEMILRNAGDARYVPVRFAEHSVMRMLRDCGILSSTVGSIFDGTFQLEQFQLELRQMRHRSPVALAGAGSELLRRGKPQAACRFSAAAVAMLSAEKKAGRRLDSANTTLILHKHAINLVRRRDRGLAVEFLHELRDEPLVAGDYDWPLLQLAFVCGDRDEAERLFKSRQRRGLMTDVWRSAMEGCLKNGFFTPIQLGRMSEMMTKETKAIDVVVGPSHSVRWQWHRRDGVVPGSLPAGRILGIGGAPVWSGALYEKTVSALDGAGHFALLVPDFRFGNGIALDVAASSGPLLQDGFLGITPAALTMENDLLMLKRSMDALSLWHERFGERARYVFWCLFARQVHDRLAGKHLGEGRYHHPVFNYDEITAALSDLDIVDLSPLLRRPMHDVRRLFIDTSSHPSQVGYLLLNGLLFDGLDANSAYDRAVATVEADLVALARQIRGWAGKPVLMTGRSVWLDVLMQTLGATGQAKLAEAGLVLIPIDRGPGQLALAEVLRQYPLASCLPVVVSAGGADLSAQLSQLFTTSPDFWCVQPVFDWESATEAAIRSRGETPRFTRIATQLPSLPGAIRLDLPAHAVEQGPLGMPSWSGILAVLQALTEKFSAGLGWRTEGDVLLTRNNVAFLIGGNHGVLRFATGELTPSAESLAAFSDNIASRVVLARNANFNYLHVIFPDKQSVLSDDFPFTPLHRLGDAYMACLNPRLCPHVLWPADQLKLETKSPFLPLDTHMTDHGSLAVLRIMLQAIGMEADGALERIGSRIVRLQRWQGDLGSKFDPPLFQEGLLLEPDWPKIRFRSPGGFNDGMVDIVFNPEAQVDKTVLLFGDSFFRMMLSHLSAVFTRVICLRTRFLHPEMVTLIRPNIVFTGNAERYLSNVSPDTEAQAFALYPHPWGSKDLSDDAGFLAAWAAVTAPYSQRSKQFMIDCGFG
ncbi:hypothetical protein [Azonexus sp.]|uniref:hypothetical protein n=1 Tax=Azonexus sp. TaxID=1872668 RepID=UPI0027B8F90C|nr:hypothetical protein [Azonexus sp.]